MNNPNDRLMARLMERMEDQVSAAAGRSFDLAAGKRRFMTWLAEGDSQMGDVEGISRPVLSGNRVGVSHLGYGSAATRILLGGRLRRLREIAMITVEDAAYHIRASRSKISRMELGRVNFKARDVADLLHLYGVTDPHERDELLYLVRQANEPPWWREYADVLPEWLEPYLALEEAAAEIRTYDAQRVPELLQTEDYARALARQADPGAAEWEIDRRLQVLKERQAAFTRSGAPRLRSLIDEAALRRQVGGTDVMRDQLWYLAEASSLPGMATRVIPLSSGASSAISCSFAVLHFADPDLPDVIYIEQLTSALYLEQRSDIERYVEALDVLEGHAAGPARTVAILRGILGGQPVG